MEEKRKMKRMINFIFLMVAVFVLASCFQRTVYDEYAHTPIAGWEKNDTLSFDIPPILTTGYYQESLGLRITGAYPFTGLTLIVDQTIYPANKQEDRIEKPIPCSANSLEKTVPAQDRESAIINTTSPSICIR